MDVETFVNVFFYSLDKKRGEFNEWMNILELFALQQNQLMEYFCPNQQLMNYFLGLLPNQHHLLESNWKPLQEILNPKILKLLLLKELSSAETAKTLKQSLKYLTYFLQLQDMETHIDSFLPAGTTNQDGNTSITGTTAIISETGANAQYSNDSKTKRVRVSSPMEKTEDVIESPLIPKKSETQDQTTSAMCSSKYKVFH